MKTKKPLGYYDYTVVLTYMGMICSFIAIMLSINENFLDAIIFLMMAGVCDMFDGNIANTKDRTPSEKRFGIQIDSLSDLISFGVMPAIFVYMITGKSIVGGVIAVLLPVVFWLQGSGKIHSIISYMLLLVLCGALFLSPFEIKKPNLVGKICLIAVGVLEFLGVFFLGWDLV